MGEKRQVTVFAVRGGEPAVQERRLKDTEISIRLLVTHKKKVLAINAI